MTISSWLADATAILKKSGIDSARLDAQLILSFCLQHDRSWLLAHDDELIHKDIESAANGMLAERATRVPLAYLFACKEFYGRHFWVTPDVLIPRPETEELIELTLSVARPGDRIIDVGTGSGAIAVTLAAERPELHVEACDVSEAALKVAAFNNKICDGHVKLYQSDLLGNGTGLYAIVVANLPYVAPDVAISPDARFEPDLALFAEDDGYGLIERLIPQAAAKIVSGGYLLLESDPWQQDRIVSAAESAGFTLHARPRRFHLVFQRA